MSTLTKRILILLISVVFTLSVHAQPYNFSTKALKKHIEFLASEACAGREPGTKGEALAIQYLSKEFKALHLSPMGNTGYEQPFSYKTRLNPHDTIGEGKQKNGSNVIGFLDNGSKYTLVIGAHFDHLGKDSHPSSLDVHKDRIHYGADDNASGTAGVLELARYYVTNGKTEPCNFLFMCYSGEEDGLIGSKYFTNNPTYPLSSIRCMINMDMIGRLNDSTYKLMVYGVGTSPAYTAVFSNLPGNLKLVYDSSGIGPSDQTSFYLKQIPVLHFFTGQHKDYHKSTDTHDKINYPGEIKVLELIAQVSDALSKLDTIAFTPTKQNEQVKVSFKVTLGIMPDYTYEGKGVRVDAVTTGKPASNAGIQAGDIILQLGEIPTTSMQGYMKALSAFKKGDHTQVIILRQEKEHKLEISF
ncbi:MAG: M28 family peptidase [Bacteroidia bacterium]